MVKIIQRDPFREIERMFDDSFFGFVPALRRNMEPPMDLYQTEKSVIVEIHVPKINPSKINVFVEDGMLKVEGATEEEKEEESKEYYRKEIKTGSFSRMIALPVEIKEDQIDATVENGILKIVMPKAELRQPKKVDVKVK